MPTIRENSVAASDHLMTQVRHFILRTSIGTRWRPGHRVTISADGAFEEVNCPHPAIIGPATPPPADVDAEGEVARWVATCLVIAICSSSAILFSPPLALQAVAVFSLTLSAALLAGLLVWVIFGGSNGPEA